MLKIYFPEFLSVYKVFESVTGMLVFEVAPLPRDIVSLGADGIV